jgi:flagellar hook protein FlgE
VHLGAIHRQHRHAHQTGVGAELQHVAEQTSQGRLVALAKARDRAVSGRWFAAISRNATSSTHARSITRDERRPVA